MFALYLGWKAHSRDWRMLVPINEMDMTTGLRMIDPAEEGEKKPGWIPRITRAFF